MLHKAFLLSTILFFGVPIAPVNAERQVYQCDLPKAPLPPMVSCEADVMEDALGTIAADLTTDPTSTFEGFILQASTTDAAEFEVAVDQYATPNFPDRSSPSVIAQPLTETDVRAVVLYAGLCDYTLKVRSGGHSYLALSSCDIAEAPCLQVDVGLMNATDLVTSDDDDGNGSSTQLVVAPGLKLEGIHDVLGANGLFIPTGECAKVGLGGHVQTGGFGMWGRQFGPMARYVHSFRIVLADGSAHRIETPAENTTALNDDLFFAVLGGGSGSWGVLTEVTLDTVSDADYFQAYWNVVLAWPTVDSLVNQFRVWSDLADANRMDSRWSTHTSFFSTFDPAEPSAVEWEMSWVAPLAEADDYDFEFFQTIIDACIGCSPLFSFNQTLPLSFALSQNYTSAEDGREFPPLPRYEKAWQQTSTFPGADEMEAIVRKIDELMANTSYGFISQLSSGAGSGVMDETRGLPWQTDVYGVTTDIFYAAPEQQPFIASMRDEINDVILNSFGEDHRMYWGAYGDVSFPNDVPLYFDSDATYTRLQNIKGCVDPNNLFQHRMSIPLPSDDQIMSIPLPSDDQDATKTDSPTAAPTDDISKASLAKSWWVAVAVLAFGAVPV